MKQIHFNYYCRIINSISTTYNKLYKLEKFTTTTTIILWAETLNLSLIQLNIEYLNICFSISLKIDTHLVRLFGNNHRRKFYPKKKLYII